MVQMFVLFSKIESHSINLLTLTTTWFCNTKIDGMNFHRFRLGLEHALMQPQGGQGLHLSCVQIRLINLKSLSQHIMARKLEVSYRNRNRLRQDELYTT